GIDVLGNGIDQLDNNRLRRFGVERLAHANVAEKVIDILAGARADCVRALEFALETDAALLGRDSLPLGAAALRVCAGARVHGKTNGLVVRIRARVPFGIDEYERAGFAELF